MDECVCELYLKKKDFRAMDIYKQMKQKITFKFS